MSVVVNNNVASLIAQRNLNSNTSNLVKSIERLSSGFRINRASDDAAGLSISENLRGQIRGNKQAINNIQDGINLLQIAESGLTVMNENIQRIRELCVQAANDTNGASEKDAILTEVRARLADINRIADATEFNKLKLLDGTYGGGNPLVIQIGAGAASTDTLDISSVLGNAHATALGNGAGTDTSSGPVVPVTTNGINLDSGIDGGNWSGEIIRAYVGNLDTALASITTKRSNLGAYQNRLESALDNLNVMTENLQSAESRIRDLDIAQETASMTKYQILQQASASVLSQANGIPQIALALLQG